MKTIIMTLATLTLSGTLAFANGHDVKEACSADVATTGCTAKGKEQVKCLQDYKKANKDFKFSESCKASFKEAKEERKAKRAARKEDKKDTK